MKHKKVDENPIVISFILSLSKLFLWNIRKIDAAELCFATNKMYWGKYI